MATPVIKHASLTNAVANPNVLVDGPKWDATHTVTGLENVPNVDTTNATNLTSGTVVAARMPAFTGDITTSAGAVATTLATVNGNVGSWGSTTQSPTFTVNGKGLITAVANQMIQPAVGSITGLGTGIGTALALNVGSAGAPVTFNGALGAPLSGTATNITGLPLSTGVTGTLATANGGLGNTAGAWTTWTPTVTPGSGSFTSVSAAGAWYAIGKLVHFTVTITITTAGTAAGTMSIALPTGTANRNAAVFAQDFGGVGNLGFGRILASGTTISSILKYDNTTYIASANAVVLTGIYEQT